jgi:hypothetical protein
MYLYEIGFFGLMMAYSIYFIIVFKQAISGEGNILNSTHIIRPIIYNFIIYNFIIYNLAYIVKILFFYSNPQVTKTLCMLLGTSENICLLYKKNNYSTIKSNSFNEWLAGLIDGDGCFCLSKKGYASLEITMDIRDSLCLHKIKNVYGGSIKIRSNAKVLRYRLHHKEGLLKLIKDVNGEIRNSNRILQMIKICDKYNIEFKYPNALYKNNNWLSGFFDSNGTITIDKSNLQLSISISQKDKQLLEPLLQLYNGNIYVDRSSNTFKWYVTKREDILSLVEYFKLYPCYSEKKNRLFLINKFYELKYLNKKNIPEYEKLLSDFFNKWDNYSRI